MSRYEEQVSAKEIEAQLSSHAKHGPSPICPYTGTGDLATLESDIPLTVRLGWNQPSFFFGVGGGVCKRTHQIDSVAISHLTSCSMQAEATRHGCRKKQPNQLAIGFRSRPHLAPRSAPRTTQIQSQYSRLLLESPIAGPILLTAIADKAGHDNPIFMKDLCYHVSAFFCKCTTNSATKGTTAYARTGKFFGIRSDQCCADSLCYSQFIGDQIKVWDAFYQWFDSAYMDCRPRRVVRRQEHEWEIVVTC